MSNQDLFIDLITIHGIYIMCLSEAWLSSDKGSGNLLSICPVGYTAIHRLRERTILRRCGGGVALLLRSSLTASHYKLRFPSSPFELLDTVVSTNHTSDRVMVIYRPPSSIISIFLDEFA